MRGTRNRDVFRRIVLSALLVAIGTLETAAAPMLRVVTSTTDLASLTREVGGNLVEVTALAVGFDDPHVVPAGASSLLKLKRADLLIVIGLAMENAWLGTGLTTLSPIVQCQNPRIQFGSAGYFDISRY